MNRQTKRMMQRQGQMAPDGSPARTETPRPVPKPANQRIGAAEYARQVRAELRKVAWPTRSEVANYSVVVLVALVVLTAVIFGLDFVFGQAVLFLFS